MLGIKLYKEKISRDVKAIGRLMISMGLYYFHILNLFRFINRKLQRNESIKILAYHNIGNGKYLNLDVPEEMFRNHIEFLIRHNFNIISLGDAVKLLKSTHPIPKDTIVITFDDGYKSMYTSVFPLVKKYNIPITIFLCVDPLEKQYPLFIDALIYAVDNSIEKTLDLSSFGLKNYSLKSSPLKEQAIREINEYSKILCKLKKEKLLAFIFEQLKVDIASPELRNKMLSWDEIKEMKRYAVTFGAHSLSHPVLSNIPLGDAEKEIFTSKKLIEEKLDENITLFAYPYGSNKDFNIEVVKVVEQNGFSCACTLLAGDNKKGDNLFSLKRIMIINNISIKPLMIFSTALFATKISGIFDVLLFKPSAKQNSIA